MRPHRYSAVGDRDQPTIQVASPGPRHAFRRHRRSNLCRNTVRRPLCEGRSGRRFLPGTIFHQSRGFWIGSEFSASGARHRRGKSPSVVRCFSEVGRLSFEQYFAYSAHELRVRHADASPNQQRQRTTFKLCGAFDFDLSGVTGAQSRTKVLRSDIGSIFYSDSESWQVPPEDHIEPAPMSLRRLLLLCSIVPPLASELEASFGQEPAIDIPECSLRFQPLTDFRHHPLTVPCEHSASLLSGLRTPVPDQVWTDSTDFNYLLELTARLQPSILVVLIDLDAAIPAVSRIPMIWAVPGHVETPPFGRLIRIDKAWVEG